MLPPVNPRRPGRSRPLPFNLPRLPSHPSPRPTTWRASRHLLAILSITPSSERGEAANIILLLRHHQLVQLLSRLGQNDLVDRPVLRPRPLPRRCSSTRGRKYPLLEQEEEERTWGKVRRSEKMQRLLHLAHRKDVFVRRNQRRSHQPFSSDQGLALSQAQTTPRLR